MTMTLEERERRAYIEGRVEEAAVLALAQDVQHDVIAELEHEIDSLRDEVDHLHGEIADLEDELDEQS